jgi:predicted acyl esterase
VTVERDVKVAMAGGTALSTDTHHPAGVDDAPTILEDTPYGGSTGAARVPSG